MTEEVKRIRKRPISLQNYIMYLKVDPATPLRTRFRSNTTFEPTHRLSTLAESDGHDDSPYWMSKVLSSKGCIRSCNRRAFHIRKRLEVYIEIQVVMDWNGGFLPSFSLSTPLISFFPYVTPSYRPMVITDFSHNISHPTSIASTNLNLANLSFNYVN